MILVGNQRGGATDLARHLMKSENEHVEVFDVRGFVASDLLGAFRESYAISRSTQCKQHLFSLSLSPPKGESVSNAAFEKAVQQAEERLGLKGQPRAIVFHDKRGDDGELRRHAHVVWCRVDCSKMKAIQLSFSHRRLQSLSRQLYLEHGWQMPRGLLQQGFCDPRNFTLEEWQQAKRRQRDPRTLKAMFMDAWAISDSKQAFENALLEKGFALARGSRRGFVAVDHTGEVYSLSRWTGKKSKDLRSILGDERQLRSTKVAGNEIAAMTVSRLELLREELNTKRRTAQNELIANLIEDQSKQLAAQTQRHQELLASLTSEQAARFRSGLMGLLDRLSGRRKRITDENRLERERLHRQLSWERTNLRRALGRRRLTAAKISEAESKTSHSTIVEDIATIHTRIQSAVQKPYVDHGRKKRREP